MKSVVILSVMIIFNSAFTHAQLSASDQGCKDLRSLATSEWSEWHMEELSKIDLGPKIVEWTDSEMENLKILFTDCNKRVKWNADEKYVLSLTDRNVVSLKTYISKLRTKNSEVDSERAALDKIKNAIGSADSKPTIDEEASLLQNKEKLSSILKPGSKHWEEYRGTIALVDDKLRAISEMKSNKQAIADTKDRNAKLAAQKQKADLKLNEIRKSESVLFEKCEKIKKQLLKLTQDLSEQKQKINSALSDKRQKEILKEMDNTAYEIDKLNPKIDELGCSKFYNSN
jgi:chromosome segregation ATPase